MILKPRNHSLELKTFQSLDARTNLESKEEHYLTNIAKGFQGEIMFDQWIKNLSCDSLVLNDLLLDCHHTLFQIDSLVITPHTIYLFEVKNYEGDFLLEADR
ncbi:nuclease-related domain-containing protein [Sutcliffiella deserti]|uniref:nuclease-related domain-containing protein n=1 Tax=Sutcliffiella deserti TaxID=2875501 RepID=UPI001CBC21E3|nr:nuclease-related domain-containing protein [Sutcliffiella deserti]